MKRDHFGTSCSFGPSFDWLMWSCATCGFRGLVVALKGTSDRAFMERAIDAHNTVNPSCTKRRLRKDAARPSLAGGTT